MANGHSQRRGVVAKGGCGFGACVSTTTGRIPARAACNVSVFPFGVKQAGSRKPQIGDWDFVLIDSGVRSMGNIRSRFLP